MQVLIANIGESPVVVTSAVMALKEKRNIIIEKLILITTINKKILLSVDIVRCFFEEIVPELNIEIETYSLGLEDINSEINSLIFLQKTHALLEANKAQTVHILPTGGRKSMSALIGFMALFYNNINGIYQILDKYEEIPDKKNFHHAEDLDELYYNNDIVKLKKILNPSCESVNLFNLPLLSVGRAEEIKRMLVSSDIEESSVLGSLDISSNLNISSEEKAFFRTVFEENKPSAIWVANQARERYRLSQNEERKDFLSLIKLLRDENFRNRTADKESCGKHGSFKGSQKGEFFYLAKKRRTIVRVFWYQNDDGIVICDLATHGNTKPDEYETKSKVFKKTKPSYTAYKPDFNIGDLIAEEEGVLIASVGKSPLVVTQAYRCLEKAKQNNIKKVYLLHTKNSKVKIGVKAIKEVLSIELNNPEAVMNEELPDSDIDTYENCRRFIDSMLDIINKASNDHPEKIIYLLLSGGRKGMALLSLIAAQQAGLKKVFHTLVSNPELEKELVYQDQINRILSFNNTESKNNYLLLKDYDINSFNLFELPLIHFK